MRTSWPNFPEHELMCKCGCGQTNPNPEFERFMDKMQLLRNRVGFALPLTSVYRCPNHPIEKAKDKPGQHSIAAADISVSYYKAYRVLIEACKLGFTGIGIRQSGDPNKRIIHLDPRPVQVARVWSY